MICLFLCSLNLGISKSFQHQLTNQSGICRVPTDVRLYPNLQGHLTKVGTFLCVSPYICNSAFMFSTTVVQMHMIQYSKTSVAQPVKDASNSEIKHIRQSLTTASGKKKKKMLAHLNTLKIALFSLNTKIYKTLPFLSSRVRTKTKNSGAIGQREDST